MNDYHANDCPPPPPQSEPWGAPRPPMPDTYLVWAILATTCCCLPLGVVAIVKSLEVNSHYVAGDYEGARAASNSARQWCIYALVAVIVPVIFIVGFYLLLFFGVLASAL